MNIGSINIGRFQKVAAIQNIFTCDHCPIEIRKGTILHDRSRDLQLLNLTVTNRGNVTVDEIEIKIISYDKYDNPIPEENGQIGQICRFSDSGCLPDQTIGEGEVIILPSSEVVNCDIMVTRVKTAGNVEFLFTDEDYAVQPPEIVEDVDRTEHNRKLYVILLAVLGGTVLLYLILLISGWCIKHVAIPGGNEATFREYLEQKDYDAALRQLEKMEDSTRYEEVVLQALENCMEEGDYDGALKYAAKSENDNKTYQTLNRIVALLEQKGDFDTALSYAIKKGNKQLQASVYADAVAYHAKKGDFQTALIWVALSGDTTLGRQIWREAVTHYASIGDSVTALEYAIKAEDDALIRSVYAEAIRSLLTQEDYNRAALMMAQCGLMKEGSVTEETWQDAYRKADRNYIRLHTASFWQVLSFSQKQALYARTAAISQDVIAVTSSGSVIGTASYDWRTSDAVSVAIGPTHAAVLLSDGTVKAQGENEDRQCEVNGWSNVVSVACGNRHTVGLRADGTVLATGGNEYGQCDVGEWTDVVQVACGAFFTVGLRSDGTVLAAGRNNAGQCSVSAWKDIILLSAGENHTVGLRYNGTAIAAGVAMSSKCIVDEWQNVTDIAAGSDHTVGLRADGSALLAGGGLIGVKSLDLSGMVLIAAGDENLLAIHAGGVTCLGSGKCDVSDLSDIALP